MQKNKSLKNALLSDIVIGTSAAPTYLPPHYFKTEDSYGKMKEFDLIDGGVAANNPVKKVAIYDEPNQTTCLTMS